MATIAVYLVLGLAAGALSGLMGIGGGLLLIPALIYLFKFSQLQAQGTTMALLLPPIGLLAAMVYYKNGYVDMKAALFICLGFFIGGFFGAKAAVGLSNMFLQKLFGAVMFLVSLKMIFGK
ncbi:MAG: TSUP family transporter [Candidatus Omnitrophica bacterium]|nr:TSUP family transporter [Candidatus Omnitrophota bacterium]MDD5310308.1 TSUP family transporter [Candidatus Omnitrophota bacterium]MDD5545853.1 TSUP family transporter [Candidatus Omnitrophota bacterium]